MLPVIRGYSIRACPCIPAKCGGVVTLALENQNLSFKHGNCSNVVVLAGHRGLRDGLDAVLRKSDQPPRLCGVLLQQGVALAAVKQVHTFPKGGKLISIRSTLASLIHEP